MKAGNSDVDDFLHQMSSSQFSEWQRFYSFEPFGDQVIDIHLSAIRAQIANYLRPSGQPAFSIKDFMLSYVVPEKEATVEELYEIFTRGVSVR